MSNIQNRRQKNSQPAQRDIEQVRGFLSAMEERDLIRAQHYLAANVVMQFPGAPPMQLLNEVVQWAATRYHRVSKTCHAVDQCLYSNGSVVVCHGVLTVEWLDGKITTGVRFIDRFELTDGLITRQDVWNDLAIARH